MRLIDQIRSGQRELVVSQYLDGRETEYKICKTLDEASEFVAVTMAPRWHRGLPSWQWLGLDGCNEFDPYGPEVAEVERAIGLYAEIET